MSKEKMTIALDFDDVLGDCNGYALLRTNAKYGTNLTLEDINHWGEGGSDADKRLECFEDAEFFRTQPLLPGAKEFVHELAAGGRREVFIVTAIDLRFAHIRAQKILEELPDIKPENILIGARKDIVRTTVLLDDKAENVLKSTADYSVLFRRPWNNHLTGMLSVNNYREFLAMVERIEKNLYAVTETKNSTPKVIALVGPSGAGKTAIARKLAESPLFAIPRSTTTRAPREGEEATAYHFVSREEFNSKKELGCFLETTSYAGESYGTTREEIEQIWKQGKHAVMPIDICGANAMHAVFGAQAVSVFINRPRRDVISAILERSVPNSDKTKRLISLDHEYANRDICDLSVNNDGTIESTAQKIFELIV